MVPPLIKKSVSNVHGTLHTLYDPCSGLPHYNMATKKMIVFIHHHQAFVIIMTFSYLYLYLLGYDKFEDTKGVRRSCKLKKYRQYNDQQTKNNNQ